MGQQSKVSRRKFVKTMVGGVAIGSITGTLPQISGLMAQIHPPKGMSARPLGATGHMVKLFSLGGQATLEEGGRTEDALDIINRAIDLGVNYIDTAAWYGGGVSETYVGMVMKNRRKEVFLATKTHDRGYDGSMRLLETSLKHLQTDHLDLWQLHNVRTEDDLGRIFSMGGALKALEKARDEKIVRFIGITGHRNPFVLRDAIERHPFDCILMALNAADKHNASFIDHLLPVAVKRNMGIIGMKIPSRGKIFREGGLTTMKQAMEYVLTLPVSTVIVGISSIKELEENIRLAEEFVPLNDTDMRKLEELTRPYHADALWYKTLW